MTEKLPTLQYKRGLLVERAKSVAKRGMLVMDVGGLMTVALISTARMGAGTWPSLEEIWRWLPPVFRSEAGLIALIGYLVLRGTYLSAKGRAFFDDGQTDTDEGEIA